MPWYQQKWVKHCATAVVAAGMYVLASKFPAYAAALAALAATLPSSVGSGSGDS